MVENLSENYKDGVSVCVFGEIFPHTWGTRILVIQGRIYQDEVILNFFGTSVQCHGYRGYQTIEGHF